MKFPAINLWTKKLEEESLLFDGIIYNNNDAYFNSSYLNQEYCDSTGHVYKIVAKTVSPSAWRRQVRFLPHMYPIELEFESTGKKVAFSDFKSQVLELIDRSYSSTDEEREWKSRIVNAKSYKEILLMQTQ